MCFIFGLLLYGRVFWPVCFIVVLGVTMVSLLGFRISCRFWQSPYVCFFFVFSVLSVLVLNVFFFVDLGVHVIDFSPPLSN